jgi:lambda repressor-like predicted transcriptional regulator
MSISPIASNAAGALQWQSTTRPQRPNFEQDMQPVADLLGVSTDELRQDVQRGKSLTEIASAKGVSRDDLVATLKQAIQSNGPAGAPSDFAAHLDDMVNRIVDHKGGVHGPHQHHRARPDDAPGTDFTAKAEAVLSTIAGQLDLSPDDLLAQLQQGVSLRDIAAQAGSDPSQLLDTIGRGLAVNVLA